MEDNHLEEALVAIRRVMRATEINSLSLAKKSQLTPTQHIVLQIIANKKHTTPSHISYITTLRHTTIATVINKLLSNDLITREKGINDKRIQYLNITEEGLKILESSPDVLQDKFKEQFSSLNDWEQSMIVSCLQRVAQFIGAEEIDAAPILDYGGLNEAPDEILNED
jgi:DNA-binding MarR family transcriptional regulator